MLAWLRLGFSVAAIVVIQLNPARVARFPILSQIALFSFLVYSLAVLYLTKKEKLGTEKIGVVTTCFDFLWVTLLVFSTGASRTPFFVFYLFPVITASSRWGVKGGLAASLVGVTLWGAVRFSPGWPNPLGIDTFIIRSIYLVVLAYIFGFISEFENKQNQKLMALNKTVAEAATQEERRRIARELHDRLLQLLASLTLRLEASRRHLLSSPSELARELELMEETTRSSIVEIRGFLAGKDTQVLPPGTLLERLREEMKFLRDGLGLTAILETEPEELALPPETEREIYYVLREGLINVARHSHASRAELFLKEADGKIHGSLADDGVGFDPAKVTDREGIGLITMEERIRRLGGHLSIESAPGKGTRIFLAAPLNIPAAERQL